MCADQYTWYVTRGVWGSSFCFTRLWKCVDTRIFGQLVPFLSQWRSVAANKDRPSIWTRELIIRQVYGFKGHVLHRVWNCGQGLCLGLGSKPHVPTWFFWEYLTSPGLMCIFQGFKWPGIFLVSPDWDVSPLQGYAQNVVGWYPFTCRGGERQCECLAQEHNVVTTARAQT